MRNPVGWFEIYVQDMERARRFYEAVFGVLLQKLSGAGMPDSCYTDAEVDVWTFAKNDTGYGAAGALVKMDGAPSGGNSVLVYFTCEDCALEAKRVAENGGRIFKEKFSIGEYGFLALVFDTEDNMLGLHSLK